MKLLQRFVNLVAPAECLNCRAEGRLVCDDCLPRIVVTKRSTCFRCNRLSDGGKTCPTCRRHSPLAGVAVASHYDGQVKELIGRLKFQSAQDATEVCAELLTSLLAPHDGRFAASPRGPRMASKFNLVTCVPIPPSRRRYRGYNQSELIAKAVAKNLALPYLPTLARFGRARQVGMNREQRLAQLKGAFLPLKALQGAKILIIDDVLTTGATLSECASALKQAGARSVWGAVVAKH